ncbi:MAG: PocR ligand-binding domain-containing protein [Oscillospiraceae bacterium]|jgi:AraC-like DNA-binding protein/ligand-binding sensor protein|nr:PocR ligand-binding domain-containing protein [Oscillospiraceae bacterium]
MMSSEQGIYQLVARDALHEVLETFHACLRLPICLLDEAGETLATYGEESSYCDLLRRRVFAPEVCSAAHADAARQALALGEPYVFACPAQLTHIIFPLAHRQRLLGCILVGPFLMDMPDSTLVSALADRQSLPSSLLLELYDEVRTLPIVPPEQARQTSRLLNALIAPMIPAQQMLLRQERAQFTQQARINETIQRYKTQGVADSAQPYPYEKEKELLAKVRIGDGQAAKGVLNDLLGYVFFCEGGRMETMKNRSMELCTLLSRIAIEGGALTDSVFRLNNQFLASLQSIGTLEALCFQLQEVVEAFMAAMFTPAGPGQETIRRAIAHIARHYAEPLTLETVAAEAGLSPAYFSTLFKQVSGVSFRAYLNQVRVEESKRLLSATDYPLVDIAMAMGFTDQSYYSKVFKKYTGLTPKQYR